jgi:hypothetical protein
VALVAATWRATPLRIFEALVARERRPASRDYFLAYSAGLIEQHVYYHGLEPVEGPLRAADVLILGNSRTMHALPRPFVTQLASRYHLRGYLLGFGGSEGDVFPLALIEKYDLRPRWVIVAVPRFFTGRSAAARSAMRLGPLTALQVKYEGLASHLVRHAIHLVLPHLACTEYPTEPDWVVYRSISDGTWFVAASKGEPGVLARGAGTARPVPEATRAAAGRLAAIVRGRGARLLLVYVPPPAPLDDRAGAAALAALVHAPLVGPELEGLATTDGSHLTPQSAARFDAALLDSLGPYLAPGGPSAPPGR